jgi:hypothetical protein
MYLYILWEQIPTRNEREEIKEGRRLTKACSGAREASFISIASHPARPVMPIVRPTREK